ncbi:MAG: PorV/PorQ family protein [Gemmatimonadota bacterium]|nr:PorV/PorQ family protein [Gemmatimonadota bacterium]
MRAAFRRAALSSALLLGGAPVVSGAQAGLATEGAPFLLIPIGARALALGQAVVAEQGGTEAVWWNPAGLARLEKREVAIHHYQSIVGTGDAVSLAIPSSLLGVITGSFYILNLGEEPVVTEDQIQTGTVLLRDLVYAATYATTIGSRINAGLTFKIVQLRFDCSGVCTGLPVGAASTSAVDAGVQYSIPGTAPIWIGVAVRNMGPRLQVKDNAQADPLPARIQFGATYRVTPLERYTRDVDIRVTADLIDELDLESPSARFGADVAWRRRAFLRAGYVFKEYENSEQFGPSIGVGVATGNLHVDVARLFDGFSSDVAQPPTYLSLRYLF